MCKHRPGPAGSAPPHTAGADSAQRRGTHTRQRSMPSAVAPCAFVSLPALPDGKHHQVFPTGLTIAPGCHKLKSPACLGLRDLVCHGVGHISFPLHNFHPFLFLSAFLKKPISQMKCNGEQTVCERLTQMSLMDEAAIRCSTLFN